MVKKLLLLVLVGSMISAGGKKRKETCEVPEKNDPTQQNDRAQREATERRRVIGNANSPLEAYARLMFAKKEKAGGDCTIL